MKHNMCGKSPQKVLECLFSLSPCGRPSWAVALIKMGERRTLCFTKVRYQLRKQCYFLENQSTPLVIILDLAIGNIDWGDLGQSHTQPWSSLVAFRLVTLSVLLRIIFCSALKSLGERWNQNEIDKFTQPGLHIAVFQSYLTCSVF